ncbi:MAG: multiheme c-type cytochrome [bacterium]
MKRLLLLLLVISLAGMQSPVKGKETNISIPTIQIFYSGNIKGYLEPCGCGGKRGGGLVRWATFIKENTQNAPINLVLDSGYFVSSQKNIKDVKNEYIARAMAQMHYDAINLSEKDIPHLDKNTLINLKEKYNLPFVSANIFDKDKLLTAPYIIKSFPGVDKEIKIGIFGLSRQIKLEEGLIIKDPIDVAKEIVKSLRDRCNLVIALTQLTKGESLDLVKGVEGIDIIICDELFRVTKEGGVIKTNHTLILQPSSKGDEGRCIKVYLDKGITSFEEKNSVLEESVPVDEKIAKIIEEYKKETQEKGISQPANPFVRTIYAGTKRCSTCHDKQYKQWKKTKHAKAFQSLQRVKEEKNPECLKCHTTHFKEDNGFSDYQTTPDFINVGCEECHKLGMVHLITRQNPFVDKQIAKIGDKPGKVDSSGICTKCHTTDKDPKFNFEKDKRKVSH